ncbi:hypothetical protein [Streptomyces sp. NBC_01235]|uniref:hypothetical protein n=1 Tax=Streptomyces sp. NBC_01235 TaxID=2903788 RepID=UPI002E0DCD17|nr:hypothetical protein OG289_09020 [Streptomyces sp. NBC_01235]
MPDSTHHALSQRNSNDFCGILSPVQLPSAATDLILLGDLTGRYATGSYSRLASDGRSLVLRPDRQGAAEHGHRITAAIACHVARAGGTIDQLTQLLLHPEHEGGRHAQNKIERRKLVATFDEAERAAARNTRDVTAHVVMVKADDRTSLPRTAKDKLLDPAQGEGIDPDRDEPFPLA